MSTVTAYVSVYSDTVTARVFVKEMNFDFKPEVGEWVKPLSPHAGEYPLPDLKTKIVEAYYNDNGGLRIRLGKILFAPSYETQEAFKAVPEHYALWSSLGGGDVCEHLLDSYWREITEDD